MSISPHESEDCTAPVNKSRDSPENVRKYDHVFVMGDLCGLQFVKAEDKVPDFGFEDVAPYRRLKGFVRRSLPGGAWFLARCVRAALFDVWRWANCIDLPTQMLSVKPECYASNEFKPWEYDGSSKAIARWSPAEGLTVEAQLKEFEVTSSIGSLRDGLHFRIANPVLSAVLSRYRRAMMKGSSQSTSHDEDGKSSFLEANGVREIELLINDPVDRFMLEGARLNLTFGETRGESASEARLDWMIFPSGGITAFPVATENDGLIRVIAANRPESTRETPSGVYIAKNHLEFGQGWCFFSSKTQLGMEGGQCILTGARFLLHLAETPIPFKRFPTVIENIRLSRHDCIMAPLAAVSTYESLASLPPEDTRSRSLACPIWEIREYGHTAADTKAKSKKFRLHVARGYEGCEDENALRQSHVHGSWFPEWIGPEILKRPYQHISLIDLNLGFRKAPGFSEGIPTDNNLLWSGRGQALNKVSSKDVTEWLAALANAHKPSWWQTFACGPVPNHIDDDAKSKKNIVWPDWWHALRQWVPSIDTFGSDWRSQRGWIVAIIGRSLPLQSSSSPARDCDCTEWERGDLWDVLRHAVYPKADDSSMPVFRDRTIVILNTHVLRSHGGQISHRLSWERTALDCADCLEQNPRFRPLLDFKHVIVRVGCSGAVYLHRRESESTNDITFEKRLLFDAIARDGYHRDPVHDGRVLGGNSVFAASILRSLLQTDTDSLSQDDAARAIREGISNGIDASQELFLHGYGDKIAWSRAHSTELEYPAIEKVLFEPFAIKPR